MVASWDLRETKRVEVRLEEENGVCDKNTLNLLLSIALMVAGSFLIAENISLPHNLSHRPC